MSGKIAAAVPITNKQATGPPCNTPALPPCLQLESAAVRVARHDAAARETELCSQLSKAQAAVREQIKKASRARRLHERSVAKRKGRRPDQPYPAAGTASGLCLLDAHLSVGLV